MEEVVQTFDPCKHHHRPNSAGFFNYINLCLANKFRSMHSTQMKNPPYPAICAYNSLGGCGSRSGGRRGLPQALGAPEEEMPAPRHTLAEFSEFIKREDNARIRI